MEVISSYTIDLATYTQQNSFMADASQSCCVLGQRVIESICSFFNEVAFLAQRVAFVAVEYFSQLLGAQDQLAGNQELNEIRVEDVQVAQNEGNIILQLNEEREEIAPRLQEAPRVLSHRFEMPRQLPIEEAERKMWKNAYKAIEEHRKKSLDSYPAPDLVLESLDVMKTKVSSAPLHFAYSVAEAQGRRPTMEDAHFVCENENALFLGVFDGHGGKDVAEYACKQFQNGFYETVLNASNNVHQAFEQLIHEVQEEIASNQKFFRQGSTAVISYIDKASSLIYTATLGDSEANIYREIDSSLKSIPISCVRDWSSPNDALRASLVMDDPEIAKEWPKVENSKYLKLRVNDGLYNFSVNVSRAFGDTLYTKDKEKPGVIHKPKITINRVQAGDILVLACDGLKDYVAEDKISKKISGITEKNLAQALVNYALEEGSYDNVSVIAVNIA